MDILLINHCSVSPIYYLLVRPASLSKNLIDKGYTKKVYTDLIRLVNNIESLSKAVKRIKNFRFEFPIWKARKRTFPAGWDAPTVLMENIGSSSFCEKEGL